MPELEWWERSTNRSRAAWAGARSMFVQALHKWPGRKLNSWKPDWNFIFALSYTIVQWIIQSVILSEINWHTYLKVVWHMSKTPRGSQWHPSGNMKMRSYQFTVARISADCSLQLFQLMKQLKWLFSGSCANTDLIWASCALPLEVHYSFCFLYLFMP